MRYWLIGTGLVLFVIVGVVGWYIHAMMPVFGMKNMIYQEVRSPDGRYMATLAYRDGMTEGYYFVCLRPTAGGHRLQPADPIPPDEVAEAAAEGVDSVRWQGSHTLVVGYEKSGVDKAQLVLQKRAWRDVRIVYRGS